MEKLVDKLGRPLQDLRISVTDKCNFRCTYCMPKEIFDKNYPFLKQDELLSFAEMIRLISQFVQLGVTKVRITGGEPLLRKNLPGFIEELSHMEGINDIALTTNGTLLGKYAEDLKRAGLHRVNVSLDSMNDHIFGEMNGRGMKVAPILDAIDIASSVGLEVKVNMVVQKGVNDGDILPMARYFREKGHTLRFIEYMDVGNSNGWKLDQVVFGRDIINMIANEFPLVKVNPKEASEVAKRYRYVDSDTEVGIITSISEAFCSTCSRARVSADGKMYTCLFATKGHDLKQVIREGSDEELLETIVSIWNNREDRYSEERLKLTKTKQKVEMSRIGG